MGDWFARLLLPAAWRGLSAFAALVAPLALAALAALPAFAAPKITLGGAPVGERPSFAVLIPADFARAAEEWTAMFEAQCGCVLTFRSVEDALGLLPALRLGGESAEVVVGLPLSALEEARASGLFAAHGRPAPMSLPMPWSDPLFMPVDYGWIGFIYDTKKLTSAPLSFPELAKAGPNALRVAIEDPRTSAAGFDAMLWLRATQKDGAGAIWSGMKPKLVMAPTHAAALAMLEKGEVDMALATTTWPAIWPAPPAPGDKPGYRVTPFREGQFLQIESAGILKSAAHPQIAEKFLAFLTTPQAQAAIASQRGMYPVHPGAAVPEAFGKLTMPSWSISLTAQEIEAKRAQWLAERDAALAK